MAKRGSSHQVTVEIQLLREQFDKDFKAAGRDIMAMQKELSLQMSRNKIQFQMDKLDPNLLEKAFSGTALGKIMDIRKETANLNTQIGFQKNKLDIAKAAMDATVASKGALSGAAIAAEKAFMREQQGRAWSTVEHKTHLEYSAVPDVVLESRFLG